MFNSPLQDWLESLNQVELSGILTEKFSNMKVKSFLQQSNKNPSSSRAVFQKNEKIIIKNAENIPVIQKIDEVHLHNFRRDSSINFNEMKFNQVNVIYGKNGSGKSSLLETIEYAITNDIRSSGDYKDKSYKDMTTEVLCTSQSGQQLVLSSNKKPAMLKKLEAFWYGTSSGSGRSMLNDQFFRFNFFDTYSAYKFALEESVEAGKRKDSNYIDKFSRLLFSDQLIVMEKNWQRYKEAFVDELENQNRRYKDNVSRNQWYKEMASEDESPEKEKSNKVILFLKDLNLKTLYINSLNDQRLEVFDILRPYVEALDEHIYVDIDKTSADMKEWKHSLLRNLEEISISINNDRISLSNLSESITWTKNKLFVVENKLNEINKRISDTDVALHQWNKFSPILLNKAYAEKLLELNNREKQLKKQLNVLKMNQAQYQVLTSLDDIRILRHDEEIQLQEELRDAEVKLRTLVKKEAEVKALYDKMAAIKMQIINLGINYLEHADGTHHDCPLCGTQHGTKDDLLKSISMTTDEKKEFEHPYLLREKNEIEDQITNLQSILRSNLESKDVLALFKEVCDCKGDSIDPNTLDFPRIKAYISSIDVIDREISKLKEQSLILENEGFTIKGIHEAKSFLNTHHLLKEVRNDLSKGSNLLTEYRQNAVLEKSRLETEWQELKMLLHRDELDKEHLVEKKAETQETWEEKNKVLKEVNAVIQLLDVASVYFVIPADVKLSKWIQKLQEAEVKVSNLIEDYDSPAYYLKRMKENEIEIERNKVSIARVQHIVDVLNNLKTLSSYAEEIVNQNIEKINRYFKALHPSEEFEEIIVESDGIYLKRKQLARLVKPYELSTGQRMAMALSILFALHSSAPNAPKFLMFDEPAANMDESQMDCFLDLLVDFIRKGEQLFITTANTHTYHALKMKFSFFQDQVSYLELVKSYDTEELVNT